MSAALAIIDDEGTSALSMRRLAADLGVEAMTLYHHFPNKDAILGGVAEAVLRDMELPGHMPEEWQEVLVVMIVAFRRALAAHPNALPLLLERPMAPPLDAETTPVSVLQAAGFDPGLFGEMYETLMAYSYGHALITAQSAEFARETFDEASFSRASRIIIRGFADQVAEELSG